MPVSKEVVSYGFILIGSAVSLLLSIPWINEPFNLYMQWTAVCIMLLGVIIVIVGLFWMWGPWKRPLGISLLAVGYSIAGLLVILMGGFIFTPLFLLSLVFFTVAWGIFAAKKWAKAAIEIITIIALLLSLFGIGNDFVINVPGVLGAIYLLWYVNRPHVAGYFGTNATRIIPKEKHILWISFFALLLLVPLTYFYISPPSRRIVDWVAIWGGGTSGSEYVFNIGDALEYNFYVDENSSSIVFSIEQGEKKIAEIWGRNGSGQAYVPTTGQYWVTASPQDTYCKVHWEIVVKMFSIRRHILQWAFLDLFLVSVLLSIKIWSKQLMKKGTE